MTQSQSLEGGLQTRRRSSTPSASNDALVTLGIGGNDAGLIGVAEECAKLDAAWPFGTRCKNHYSSGGSDSNVAAINATGPKVAAVIQGIHQRAPQAKVLVVGYPDGLPINGTLLAGGPVLQRRHQVLQLAGDPAQPVIKAAAQNNGANYVDTFTSSIGHDACKSPGTAWVNGIIPTSPAYPAASQPGRGDQHGQPGAGGPVAMAPDLTDMAVSGVRTLRAFSQRIPGAGGMLAGSLAGSSRADDPDHRRLVGDRGGGGAPARGGRRHRAARGPHQGEARRGRGRGRGRRRHGPTYPCDLTDPDDVDRMAQEVLDSTAASTSWSTTPASRSGAR